MDKEAVKRGWVEAEDKRAQSSLCNIHDQKWVNKRGSRHPSRKDGTSIFMRHYFSPQIYELRTL